MSKHLTVARPIASDDVDGLVLKFEAPGLEISHGRAPQPPNTSTGFQVSEATQIISGLKKRMKDEEQKHIDVLVLEALKPIQEKAYHEAYQLGLEDGRAKAFEDHRIEIDSLIGNLKALVTSFENAKSEIFVQNEVSIMELIRCAVQRIALREMSLAPEMIKDLVGRSLEAAQRDEQITVFVNSAHVESLIKYLSEHQRDTTLSARVRISPRDDLSEHGAVIETNYGQVDLQTETRFGRLWEELMSVAPQQKDKMSA